MKILKHQFWHFLCLAVLLFAVYVYAQQRENFYVGKLLWLGTKYWVLIAILSAVIHQVYVVISWRAELYYKSFSNRFGTKGFKIFKIVFAILILSRPITILILAIANAQTINMSTTSSYLISGFLLIPSVYLHYSVRKYFGIDRAFGIDHFDPKTARNTPFVKKGIFKYTSNAMYVFGFFVLWIPGVLLQSEAALILALFHHLYIWVHYYFTELPDIKFIYGIVDETNQNFKISLD